MKFLSITLTTLLTAASAAPTAITKRWPSGSIITPSALAIYSGDIGAIDAGVTNGYVYKNFADGGKWRSTLVTLHVPAGLDSKTCTLNFWLDSTDPAALYSGSGKIDVFSSLQPAPNYDVPSWGGPGNQRNLHLGRLNVKYGGKATIDPDVPSTGLSFPCPKAGDYGYEVVGVYDNDEVKWTGSLSGLYISY